MKDQPVDVFVFWSYTGLDYFPPCLGGRATIRREDGTYFVPGAQCWVRPLHILPIEKGMKLDAYLHALRSAYREKARRLKEEYKAKAAQFAPWIQENI